MEAGAEPQRRVPVAVLRPPLARCKPTGVALAEGDRVLLMPDRGGVAKALRRRLEKRGVEVIALDPEQDTTALAEHLGGLAAEVPIRGLYWLPALDADEAREMVDAMGDRPVCILRGHGITAGGSSVEQAVARALAIDALARMAGRVREMGGTPTALPPEDLAELPDLGSTFNDELIWQHYEARLDHAGLSVSPSD